jgi:hypothetical protein
VTELNFELQPLIHAALGGHQQHRSNIVGRAAPPLFLRREPSGKVLLRVGQNHALVGLPKLTRTFSSCGVLRRKKGAVFWLQLLQAAVIAAGHTSLPVCH